MHVVISGYYGFGNTGDEAILLSIIQALKKVMPSIQITALSHTPEQTATSFQVQSVNRWNFRDIKRVIKASDGLISGGGSLLQDSTSIKTVPYYTGLIHIARWYKKPTFVYAQGIGPFRYKISKWLVQKTLRHVNYITIRDQNSQQLLQQLSIQQPMQLVPDPVLGLVTTAIKPTIKKRPYIVVSVRPWKDAKSYLSKMATYLDQMVAKGFDIIFLPMHDKTDEMTAKQIAGFMTEKSEMISNLSLEEKASIIKDATLVIGVRLHALVFSAITNVPFIALSYDPKIEAFANQCQMPLIGHISNDDWQAENLLQQTNKILAELQKYKATLKQKTDIYQMQALDTAKLVLQTFKS